MSSASAAADQFHQWPAATGRGDGEAAAVGEDAGRAGGDATRPVGEAAASADPSVEMLRQLSRDDNWLIPLR